MRGWIFLGVQIVGNSIISILVVKKDPELARRRATFGEGTKRWDFVMLGVFGMTFLGVLLVAALDTISGLTLKNGVEKTLMERIPELTGIKDATDHTVTEHAYYQ